MVKSYLYHFFWHKFSVIYRSLSTWQKAFILLIPGYIVLLFTFLGGKSVKSDPYFFCFRNPPSARSLLWVPPSSLANVSQSNLFQMMIIQQQQQQQQKRRIPHWNILRKRLFVILPPLYNFKSSFGMGKNRGVLIWQKLWIMSDYYVSVTRFREIWWHLQ